jgi:ribosome maturation protein Sdo1
LKYRILDFELDRRLDKLHKLLRRQQKEHLKLFGFREVKEIVTEIIHVRSQSIVEFEAIERNIKLIGDWYSAKVYGLVEKKFHLDEWRKNIKEKFETLEDVYAMASENFSLSLNKRVEILLLFGWFLLLIGWFVFLFLEIVFLS